MKRRENRSGSIYYNEKTDRWFGEIQWTDKNGTTRRKKFSSAKRITVKNKLDDFKKKLAIEGGNFDGDNVLFEDFAIHWMNSLMLNKLKPSSFSRKEVTLTHQVYPFIGKIPINKITHADVQNMVNSLNEQGLSYSTIKKAYETVAECLKEYRVKNGVMFNPCEGITLPSNKQKDISNITYFDDDQREAIKREATRKYKNGESVYRLGNAIIFLMYTGLRIGELLAL